MVESVSADVRIYGCRKRVRAMVKDRVMIRVRVRDKVRVRVRNRVRRCLNE